MNQRTPLTQSRHHHPATVPAKKLVQKENHQSGSRQLSFRRKAFQSPEFRSEEKSRRKIDFMISRAIYQTTFISAMSMVRVSLKIFTNISHRIFILSSITRASYEMGFRC